jgi:hypothetical protein
VGAVLGVMLSVNAGYDFARYQVKRSVERKVEAALNDVASSFGATAKVNGCYNVRDLGWICDMTAFSPDGKEHHRGEHLFTYEELNEF